MTTIIVADDHPILLNGLVNELTDYGYIIIAKAENGAVALDQIKKLDPDIAILDVEMPLLTGFEVIEKCKNSSLKTKFIILTSHKEKGVIHQAKELNINGYLLKDEPFTEVHNCIQNVLNNASYFSKTFSNVLENEINIELNKLKLLSPTERTIVRLVALEKSSKDISELLTVSPRTIEKHRSNIIKKLELNPHQDALFLWTKEHKTIIKTL